MTSSDPQPLARVALHVHTYHSDGSDTVRELIRRASQDHVTHMAITDHDTPTAWIKTYHNLERLSPHSTLVNKQPVLGGYQFYPRDNSKSPSGDSKKDPQLLRMYWGIEFSAVVTGHPEEDVHILGLGIDLPSPEHQAQLTRIAEARMARVRAMTEEIAKKGTGIYTLLSSLVWDGVGTTVRSVIGQSMYPTRMHIAVTIEQLGLLGNLVYRSPRDLVDDNPFWDGLESSAFDPAVFPTTSEVIERIHREMKGVAVLAHPDKWEKRMEHLPQLVREGLDGYEVYGRGVFRRPEHPLTESAFEARLLAEAKSLSLSLITGGRDYHGAYNPQRIRTATFGVPISQHHVDDLDAAILRYKSS